MTNEQRRKKTKEYNEIIRELATYKGKFKLTLGDPNSLRINKRYGELKKATSLDDRLMKIKLLLGEIKSQYV